MRNIPRRADIERQMLEIGLSKPLSNDSKGFALLSKMGYKPGMSIGKRNHTNEGIKEPIMVPIKISRTGLGHETEEEEKRKRHAEFRMKNLVAKEKAQVFFVNFNISVY